MHKLRLYKFLPMSTDTSTMPDDRSAQPLRNDQLHQAYQRPAVKQPMAHVALRSRQLLALTAELDEAVCSRQPRNELREYISAIEFIAAELEAVCVRIELERKKWEI